MATVATKTDLQEMGNKIMSAIGDYAAAVKTSFDEISLSVDGIAGDVKQLKDTIDKLQNSPGTITPEDQALLDGIQSQAKALADKVKALDDATAPPEVPTP